MANRSLMEGIPDPGAPKSKGAAPTKPGPRKLILGVLAVVLFAAAGTTYFYRSRGGSLKQPSAVDAAETKLRADLEAKNPPPPEPTEIVEQGAGHKVQKP